MVVERMCRRTSAGVAVPATTPIKISRPDVNYRLESFCRKREKKGLKITRHTCIGNEKSLRDRKVAVEMTTEMRKKRAT